MDSSGVHRYDDIIDLPHHVSSTHRHMSASERAAQFSPFAALTGHGAAISEAGRLTGVRAELDEQEKSLLDIKQQMLKAAADREPELTVTYFIPDEKKEGGQYMTVTGRLRKVDEDGRALVLADGRRIGFEDVRAIESGIFDTDTFNEETDSLK